MDSPSRSHDIIKFPTPRGTRDQYREVAKLAGLPLKTWYREALREAALEVLEEHGVEMDLLPVHPKRPRRLQPRIKVSKPKDPVPVEDEIAE